MSVFTALYTLLIGPLELFFEVLFSMANRVLENPGLSIIFLSLAMNFLVLPLYKMADEIQAEEQATEAKLKHWVTHIKKTFKGDERFMMLQTYYRQNNYKPTDPLKGSISLLLEIPFFMAAYNFLSGLSLLQGASFGPIQNLGVPDGMLVIGGVAVNLLPILMTAINLISSAIYTKNASFRSKVQLYVMAGLFLVLLYDSPSGLVFYWTLNNLFSLVKNVFMKLKNPKKVFGILVSAVGIAALVHVILTRPGTTPESKILIFCLVLMLQLPLVCYLVSKRRPQGQTEEMSKKDRMTFWVGGFFLTVLTGLLIPSGIIGASPEEFISPAIQTNPLVYILSATLTAAGFFLIWFGMFYLLANSSGRKWMSFGMCALCVIAVADFMFFGRDYGNMSANLVFDNTPVYSQQLLNVLVIAALCALVYLLWKKKQEILRFLTLTAALAAVAMSVMNMVQIQKVTAAKTEQVQQNTEDLPSIPLSRDGKNVIVLMLDRGIGCYVPYLMNERPELQEQFAGFTYYPNTLSYGGCTNFGAPSLFGGYEYTPEEMNKRDQESLESKHDEALKVMPVSFSQQGYEVSVFDPPYAGYDVIPDLSIYDDYPEIHAYNSMGAFELDNGQSGQMRATELKWNRNMFCYSVFKVAPVSFQRYVYDNGQYNNLNQQNDQVVHSLSKAEGIKPSFARAYAVLQNMENITEIRPGSENTFLMMTNDTAHDPALLSEPEYEPAESVDNTDYDREHADRFQLADRSMEITTVKQMTHYHANMAAFLKLGEWFDYLRQEGVYDNTRIIIVSDHGWNLGHMGTVSTGEGDIDTTSYHPVLMCKDFGSQEFSVDETFMTNADTATLAMEGLIENPVNPFTGKPITSDAKLEGPQHVIFTSGWDIFLNNGNVYLPDHWFAVPHDINDLDSWEYLGYK